MMHNYMKYSSNITLEQKTMCPLIPLKTLKDRYQVISCLGNGSFGSVVLAKYRKNKQSLLKIDKNKRGTLLDPLVDCQFHLSGLVAIKTMNSKSQSLHDYMKVKEIEFILAIPSHPSLVQIYEIFINCSTFELHISMESLNQNLHQLMRSRGLYKFSPLTLKSILTQLLNGIRHIHRYNFIHRDIKPENILVIPTMQYYGSKAAIPPHRKQDNYVIKLADYGLSRNLYDSDPYTSYISTRWYRSPEILLRRKWYSKPVDIWAFGAIAIEVANLTPLFPGGNELEQLWKILQVLGTPLPLYTPLSCTNYIPLGGYWKEAQHLAARLGFGFPNESGLQIFDLLPNPEHLQLAEVAKLCLAWNPDVRPDVEKICTMSYFQNTVVSLPYVEPERLSNNLGKLSSLSPQAIVNRFNLISRNQKLKEKKQRSPIKPYPVPLHSPLSQTSLNLQLPNQFSIYDDLADGYENEFMKSYVYNQYQASHSSRNLDNVMSPIMNEINPSLKDEVENENFNYYEIDYPYDEMKQSDVYFSEDDGENVHEQIESNSLWQYNEKYKLPGIQPVKPLEDEYSFVGDTSFGSEVKC